MFKENESEESKDQAFKILVDIAMKEDFLR